jgi:enediyne biosynthesis protein E4
MLSGTSWLLIARRAALGVLIGLCLPVSCGETPADSNTTESVSPPPAVTNTPAPKKVRTPPPPADPPASGPFFVEAGPETGITHTDLSGPTPETGKLFLRDTVGQGVAVLDIDGDGQMDLYFPQGTDGTPSLGDSGNRLYRNLGDGRFEEVGEQQGAADRGYGFGALAFDYDADGDSDLLVTNLGPNVLLRNDQGRFTDVTREHPGLAGLPEEWSVGAATADIDLDGDLDLYVANYCAQDLAALMKQGWCRQMSCEVPCGPRGLAPQADRVFLNSGAPDFRLVEETGQTGLLDVTPSYGFQPTFTDIDDDGDADLYVTNDSVANFLFLNDGSGHFTETALIAGVACGRAGQMEAGMGLAVGHANGDAQPEFFVTNFSTQSNSLYWNETAAIGSPWFEEISQRAGVGRPSWFQLGWGCALADFDSDGFTDVFSANGHIYEQMDNCHPASVAYRQINSLYRGSAEPGRFEDVSAAAGFTVPDAHRSAAVTDLDNDGLLDLVVTRLDETPLVLWNRTPSRSDEPAHWFGATVLEQTGSAAPRVPLGARVTVVAGDRRWTRDLTAGSSFLATEDPRIHVGLGPTTAVDRVEVRLPGKPVQTLDAPPLDRWLTLLVSEDGIELAPLPQADDQ